MFKRMVVLGFVFAAGLIFAPMMLARYPAQSDMDAFKDNSCVACHANELSSSNLSNRYLQWHLSVHKDEAVSCDKCHGGDPGTRNKEKSHTGVLPTADPKSKVNPANLVETCKACHTDVAAAFVGSTHAMKLKDSGIGPSCNTCHEHMASAVITSPPEGAALCAHCHADSGSTLPMRADIPVRAQEGMEAIERANGMVVWAQGLLDAAKERKVNVAAEEQDMIAVDDLLKKSKVAWHTFTLKDVKENADASFEKGVQVKDRLRKKLGFK